MMNPLWDTERICQKCERASSEWVTVAQKDRVYFQEIPGGKFHFSDMSCRSLCIERAVSNYPRSTYKSPVGRGR